MRERLAAIESKRQALGISREQLAIRAGIGTRTLQRGLADGRMSRGKVNTLVMALRELEKEREREQRQLRGDA